MRLGMRISIGLGSMIILLVAAMFGQQPSEARLEAFPKVTVPGSHVRTIKSTSTGRDYELYIHLPSNYEQDKNTKYPALYILDGQWDFKLMDSVLGGLVYDKFVPQMILVGVTYSGDNPNYDGLRVMDDSPVADEHVRGSGDAPRFLKFFKTELVPFVETNYRADPSHRVLQGSSFAGLFTLYAMFSDSSFFSGYVAASPYVSYADGYSFRQEAEYARSHKELPVRLYLAVGDSEGLTGPVKQFMSVIQSRGYKGLRIETRVLEGERHAGNKPEIFNRGLRFIFSE
jgi:predicted alpha/beta superfamily hydrolase